MSIQPAVRLGLRGRDVPWCVTRITIEIDDKLLTWVMSTYRLKTKSEAVDLALRRLVDEPLTTEEALALQGSGWDGDLDDMRSWSPPSLP